MRIFGLLCVLAMVACGEDEPGERTPTNTVPIDHEHPGMVPVDHEHPNAVSVEADAATGWYAVTATLTSNSCLGEDDELDTTPQDAGLWLLAMTQEEYLFMTGDFHLSSTDGVEFTYSSEGAGFFCELESYDFVTTLSFTETNLAGPYEKHYVGTNCWAGTDEETGESIYEDVDCTFTWDFTGTRQ